MTKFDAFGLLVGLLVTIILIFDVIYMITKDDSKIDFGIDHDIMPPNRTLTHIGDRIVEENRLLRSEDR